MKLTTRNSLNKAGRYAAMTLKKQLNKVRDGNKMPMKTTGELHSSIEYSVYETGGIVFLEVKGNSYGDYPLNTGRETPFSWSGVGAKPGSDYIRGLVAWLGVKKGLYGRPALQAAFRIARSQQGKSIPKSPGWINEVKDNIDEEVTNILTTETTLGVATDIYSKLNITI